ncbi:MAG: hypothetical protein II649_11990 [Kiritimatiellae bacterium]|nr:hypothetical protein [Kiritimatiellia bacterium]
MNGKRYLLDTNAFIQLLSGNDSVRAIIDDAEFLSTSVICKLEFLSYPKLDTETRNAKLGSKYCWQHGGADGENQAWLKISRIRPLRRMNFWYNSTQQTIGRRIQDVHHG